VRAYLIGVTLGLPTDELLTTVGRGKMLDMQYESGRVGVADWVAGKRRGRLSGSTRRKRGDMGRERVFDIHACSGECCILAENLGHRHNPLFSYFDSQGFS